VRMYMREMGTVELLTREGEIEIAKRIEDGLKHMVMAISACPTTIAEILAAADRISKDEIKVDEIVDGLVDLNESEQQVEAAASDDEESDEDEEDEEEDEEEGEDEEEEISQKEVELINLEDYIAGGINRSPEENLPINGGGRSRRRIAAEAINQRAQLLHCQCRFEIKNFF